MSRVRVTKEFTFESAHVLTGYDGLCSQIHGHSYRLFVTVIGIPSVAENDPKRGMVMDFGVLKEIVKRLIVDRMDHSLVLRRDAADGELAGELKRHFDRIIVTDYQPTCENMVIEFADALRRELPEGVSLHSLRLHETATSYAEWFAEDNR